MKLGFIGCGNMANAMIGGILANGILKKEEIIGADPMPEGRERTAGKHGIRTTESNRGAAEADIVVLSVKPQFYEDVIGEIKETITERQLIITLAPGKTISWLEERFAKPVKIIRTMPNTPAMVGEGMTGMCANLRVTPEDADEARRILRGFGDVEAVPEKLMDAVVAVSGSAPAYVFMMIEAMADGAVSLGMPRAQAYRFAAKAVLGSARMALDTGKHPGELKDMVCSPGGTTIEAVKVLEEMGFRSALMQAMEACADRSKSL